MDEDDERSIELSSIAAIFPELIIDPTNPYAATLDVPVTPQSPLKIYFQAATQAVPLNGATLAHSRNIDGKEAHEISAASVLPTGINVDVHQLSHLPPVKLHIDLPHGYPHETPPKVALSSDPVWLPRQTLDDLRDKCMELWQECGRDQVVYTFIDHVQQEAEKAFGLSTTDDTRKKFELSSDLKLALLDYDLKRKREQFENETFECGICLDPKKGRVCHRMFLCGHVFCVACLQDFYNNCITEGDTDNVKCLNPGCAKELSAQNTPGKKRKADYTLSPSELLQIPIQRELVQRYVRLKRKKRLESDKSTIYCPRQWCQGAARSKKHPRPEDPLEDADDLDDEADQEEKDANGDARGPSGSISMADRLAICEDCNYAFCAVCEKGWHGEQVICSAPRTDDAFKEYLRQFSTPCPTCDAPAQKSSGCNHMICFQCKTHFCYLCGAYLMESNPYLHFNHEKSPCYQRLWELEGGDGADVGIGYRGGNAAPAGPRDFELDEIEDEDEDVPIHVVQDLAEISSSDDDEPAPDQRRPDRPPVGVGGPVGARNAVRRGNNRRRGNARRPLVGNGLIPPPAPVVPANRGIRDVHHAANNAGAGGPRVPAAPGQGNNADAALQRFLQLAMQDREDEWDSGEDDIEEPVVRPRRNRRR